MLHTPGVMGRGVVLLLRDRARYTTDMMDDLVQLMSSGHVRGLYAPDELETILARLHSKYAAAHPASPQEAQPSNWDLLQCASPPPTHPVRPIPIFSVTSDCSTHVHIMVPFHA